MCQLSRADRRGYPRSRCSEKESSSRSTPRPFDAGRTNPSRTGGGSCSRMRRTRPIGQPAAPARGRWTSLTSCFTHSPTCSSTSWHSRRVTPPPPSASGCTSMSRCRGSSCTPPRRTPPGASGGLAAQAEEDRVGRLVVDGLERLSWCSSDPVCIESVGTGTDGLNLAACHACVLAPETSCEEQNVLLDRALLFGTPDEPGRGLLQRLRLERPVGEPSRGQAGYRPAGPASRRSGGDESLCDDLGHRPSQRRRDRVADLAGDLGLACRTTRGARRSPGPPRPRRA